MSESGDDASHRPHVHMIVPSGGLSDDTSRWIATSRRLTFDTFSNDKRLPPQRAHVIRGALMRLLAIFVSVAMCFAAMQAQSAGVRFFDILPDTKFRPLSGAVWYPCSAPGQETTVRNRVIQGTRDCLLIGDKLPLVVISHGRDRSSSC